MARIIVGLSGGVDSTVTAYLLKKAGHEVIGATIKTVSEADSGPSGSSTLKDAKSAADALGIRHYIRDCSAVFRQKVTEPFVQEYLHGRTPSPCIECNRYVKWEAMLELCRELGADYAATGHYARIAKLPNGRYAVRKGTYDRKDQAYMLYKLSQEQLSGTIFPLGEMTKEEVRKIAAQAGLDVARKKDSQEICFVEDGRYTDYIREHASGEEIPGEGDFVDGNGTVLGKHRGIIHYTVGQRKGLGIALGFPAFVKRIDPVSGQVVLSADEDLYTDSVICGDLNFQAIPGLKAGEQLRALVKIRYRHGGEMASIEGLEATGRAGLEETASAGFAGKARIVFDRPVRAAAPGQSAVFYDDEGYVIGGGRIEQETE